MNKEQIINELITDEWLYNTVKNINQNKRDLYEDAYQDLILSLCEMNEDKLIHSYQEGYIKFKIVRMIQFQMCDKLRKIENRSKAEKKFMYEYHTDIDTSDQTLLDKLIIEDILTIIDHHISTNQKRFNEKRNKEWFKRKVFNMWIDNNFNKSKVSSILQIDRKTIANQINTIITKIKKQTDELI